MPPILGRAAVKRQLEPSDRTPVRSANNMATTKNVIAKNYGTSALNKAAAKMFRQGGHKMRAQRSDAGKKRK